MSGLRVRGAQLLHGLWTNAERVILQGGRPPPPGGAALRAGQRAQNFARTQGHHHYSKIAAQDSKSALPDSFVTSVRSFTENAFTAVFKGMQRPSFDSVGAAQVRTMMRSAPRRTDFAASRGAFYRQPKRQVHVPHVHFPLRGNPAKVGLQLTDAFHSAPQFVVHAPFALRAALDELEDDLEKHFRQRAKAARRVGMSSSTRRSGYLTHKVDMVKAPSVTVPNKAFETKSSFVFDTPEKGDSPSTSSHDERSSVAVDSSGARSMTMEESWDDSPDRFFTYPSPRIVTHLLIPLCPEQMTIIAPMPDGSYRDDETMEEFVHRVAQTTESFAQHRLKRIVVIERAFDQEPLRQYRPALWTDSYIAQLTDGDEQTLQQVSLRVDFKDCTKGEVQDMLAQTMGSDSVRWYSNFLVERVLDHDAAAASSSDSDSGYTWTQSPQPSSDFVDIETDIRQMGVASRVSLDDYLYSPDQTTFGDHSNALAFPQIEIHGGG